MKLSNKTSIAILAVLLVVSSILNILSYKNKKEINKEREIELTIENKKLRFKNDSIKSIIVSLKKERELLFNELDSLKETSNNIDKEAKKIIRRKNETIRLIDNMHSDGLFNLFSGFEFTARQDSIP